MIPNLLKILWFLLPACILLASLVSLSIPAASLARLGPILLLHAVCLLCWTWLSFRIFGFRMRFRAFFRRLLAGNYESGIRMPSRFQDELHEIERLSNKLAEQLRAYDTLRADRVSLLARALDLVLRQSKQAFVTANPAKQTVQMNPAAQQLLGLPEKTWTFEALLAPEANASFAELFQQTLQQTRSGIEGPCQLLLPGMDTPADLQVRFLPLRHRDESVQFLLIALQPRKAT